MNRKIQFEKITPQSFRVVKVMNTTQHLPNEIIGIKDVTRLSNSRKFDVTILPKKRM
jgi:hypothetical protein